MLTVGITGTGEPSGGFGITATGGRACGAATTGRGSGGVRAQRACGRRGGPGSGLRGLLWSALEPWIAIDRRAQEVGGEAVLGGWPRPFVRAEPVRQQHPRVDHGRLRAGAQGDVRAERGPSRSSSAPRTEAGGRWSWTGGAEAALLDDRPRPRRACAARARKRRGATSGRRRGPPLAGNQRRPETPPRRSRRGRGATRGIPRCSVGGQDEVERAVEVDREPPAAGQVGYRVPAASSSQRGKALSVARSGTVREDLVRARERDDVGRISVVGERLAVLRAGRERRTRGGRRWSRAGWPLTRARRDRPAACEAGAATIDRKRSPNESPSGGPLTTATSLAPAARKRQPMALGQGRARASASQQTSGPASVSGSGCMMRTLTGRMAGV